MRIHRKFLVGALIIILVIIGIPILITHFKPFEERPVGEEEQQPGGVPWPFNDTRLERIANISLPINVSDLPNDPHLGPITTWGFHGGNHPEGFDHTGFAFDKKIPIYAPDWGIVAKVEYRHADDIKLLIFHNYSIVSWFDHFGEIFVEVGDVVEKGQIIGYPRFFAFEDDGWYAIDWGLIDFNNDTGPLFTDYIDYKNGSFVPPYDYLNQKEKEEILKKFNETMLQPFLNGEFVPSMSKAEHDLVNPIFPPRTSEDDIAGVWVYDGYWEEGGYPEMLVFIHKNSPYFGEVYHAVYADFRGVWYFDTWEASYEVDMTVTPHRVRIDFYYGGPNNVETLYGIYRIDSSGPRLKLIIEFSAETYPEDFTEKAAVYLIRTREHPLFDAKFREESPLNMKGLVHINFSNQRWEKPLLFIVLEKEVSAIHFYASFIKRPYFICIPVF